MARPPASASAYAASLRSRSRRVDGPDSTRSPFAAVLPASPRIKERTAPYVSPAARAAMPALAPPPPMSLPNWCPPRASPRSATRCTAPRPVRTFRVATPNLPELPPRCRCRRCARRARSPLPRRPSQSAPACASTPRRPSAVACSAASCFAVSPLRLKTSFSRPSSKHSFSALETADSLSFSDSPIALLLMPCSLLINAISSFDSSVILRGLDMFPGHYAQIFP